MLRVLTCERPIKMFNLLRKVERAAAIAESLIPTSGRQLERQVDVAARRWEERLHGERFYFAGYLNSDCLTVN